MEAIRDAIVSGDSKPLGAYPLCPKAITGCGELVAQAIGGGHFLADKPDNPSLSAMAIMLTREGTVEQIPSPDNWLLVMKQGQGPASDTLRVAVAKALAAHAPEYGHALDTEPEQKSLLRIVGAAIPGACETYVKLGAGVDLKMLKPEETPDHSPCVHKDLSRREGPGPRYGEGMLRAGEAAATLLRETERALRLGLDMTADDAKAVLREKLAVIEKATLALTLPRAPGAVEAATMTYLAQVHSEAGAPYVAPADAAAPKPLKKL